jgi:hypothetical protein
MRCWRVTRLDEGGTPSHGPKFCQTEHPRTTPTISVCLTLRLPNRACLHTRLFSSTHTRLKEKSKSPTFLISRTTSMSSEATTSFSTGATMSSAPNTAQLSENSDLTASLHALNAHYTGRILITSAIYKTYSRKLRAICHSRQTPYLASRPRCVLSTSTRL